jgi:26S proteasome non-ATPase regulatory subunit 9
MSQKENIEAELDAQFSILKANNIDMTTPLVDREGFPRADVDLYAIRHARRRINELRNDYKAVMNEIETALQAVYDPSTGSSPAVSEEVAQHTSLTDSAESLLAFARVDGVAPSSPAAEAGLRREDLILKFGSLARSSFAENSLQPLADLVSVNENRELQVIILRSEETMSLKLIPRKGWGGRGMLGCHIVPHES